MEIFHFIIRLDEQREITDQLLNDIDSLKRKDYILCSIGESVFIEFDRKGRIFEEAIASALEDLSKISYLFNKMSIFI